MNDTLFPIGRERIHVVVHLIIIITQASSKQREREEEGGVCPSDAQTQLLFVSAAQKYSSTSERYTNPHPHTHTKQDIAVQHSTQLRRGSSENKKERKRPFFGALIAVESDKLNEETILDTTERENFCIHSFFVRVEVDKRERESRKRRKVDIVWF